MGNHIITLKVRLSDQCIIDFTFFRSINSVFIGKQKINKIFSSHLKEQL